MIDSLSGVNWDQIPYANELKMKVKESEAMELTKCKIAEVVANLFDDEIIPNMEKLLDSGNQLLAEGNNEGAVTQAKQMVAQSKTAQKLLEAFEEINRQLSDPL